MKKRFWIEALLSLFVTMFSTHAIIQEVHEFSSNHKEAFPLKYFYLDFSNFYYWIPLLAISSWLFSVFLNRAVPFVFKSLNTPIRYWCMYQGFFVGLVSSTIAWHFMNHHIFQSVWIFKSDFIVVSLIIGVGMYFSNGKIKQIETEAPANSILSEKPINSAESDLIKIENVVDEIVTAIEGCLKTNRKLIAIYGPNGIGKTSAINLARKRLDTNNIYVTDFEPYKYGNELEMIRNFFSRMLQPLDERYILPGANTLSKKLTNILYGVSEKNSVIPFDVSKIVDVFVDTPDFYTLKETIEQYLLHLDKKIVVIVDDIDRCSIRKRHIFFQLVSAINSLTNVLIVISASAEELLNNREPEIISIVE